MDNSKATNIEEFGRWFLQGVFCPSWDGSLWHPCLLSCGISQCSGHSGLGWGRWQSGIRAELAGRKKVLLESDVELWVRYEGAKSFWKGPQTENHMITPGWHPSIKQFASLISGSLVLKQLPGVSRVDDPPDGRRL